MEEWFRAQKSEDALGVRGKADFSRRKYPYFMDWSAFDGLTDTAAFYEHIGRLEYDDFLFEPTFMFSDRFQSIFQFLVPETEFKYVQLIDPQKTDKAPTPLYWIIYLPYKDIIHPSSDIILGKAHRLVLRKETLGEERIMHAKLPADDIWLFSLEAAECILRRSPMGLTFERVEAI